MYFSFFPKLVYDLVGDKTDKLVTDLFNRLKIREKILNELTLYSTYDVLDGDTPESLAYKYYGSTQYHWIILFINNITDRYYDWPLTIEQFEIYLNDKYVNPDSIHHYEITQSSGETNGLGPSDYSHKIEVNSTTAGATAVTNREYEERLQDQKRQIKILDVSFLQPFIEEFEITIRK
jgi:hypothetical protein